MINKLYCDDCLNILPTFDDKIFDMIICDLPYGTTKCNWDSPIDLNILWVQYKELLKIMV